MLNRCMNCGGILNFDIPSGKVKCENCDSLFEPSSFTNRTNASENPENAEYSMSIFTCPNCGGEVASNELEAVEYCLYCGSFVTLNSHIQKVQKPDCILPFSKSKEECKESYSKMIKRKLYAPKEFRDESFLEGFKGIYIPFWTYNYEYGPDVKLTGVHETRSGDYIHKQYYDIDCKADGHVNGISYDASSSFDDEISSRIVPFDPKKLKNFNDSYMFGFFADTADVDSSLYEEDACEIARDEIWNQISSNAQIKDGYPEKPQSNEEFDENINLKKSSFLSMLPVWFLTWRKNDRVAYSVMNGENGEIYGEVPVDTKRYLLFSLIFAIPIFLLLNYLTTFTAAGMLKIALGLSVFMIFLYVIQLDKIVRKLLHADDKGYLEKNAEAKKKADNAGENWLGMFWEFIVSLFKGATLKGALGTLVAIVLVICSCFGSILLAVGIAAIVIVIYTIVRIIKDIKILHDGTVLLDLCGSLFSLILSIAMLMEDPAGDEFYYFAAIACIVGVGLTAIFTMKRHNELVTRPIPHFFDRKAGGDAE